MKRLFFAVFDSEQAAAEAVRTIQDPGSPAGPLKVELYDRTPISGEELDNAHSNTRAGLVKGLLFGGLGGAILGALFHLGLKIGPTLAMMALLTAGVGAVIGAIGGLLQSASDPDRKLERSAEKLRPGQVLLAVEAPDGEHQSEAERLLSRLGATIRHKAVV